MGAGQGRRVLMAAICLLRAVQQWQQCPSPTTPPGPRPRQGSRSAGSRALPRRPRLAAGPPKPCGSPAGPGPGTTGAGAAGPCTRSPTSHRPSLPCHLADYGRGRCGVEALHHIRDTFAENAPRPAPATPPRAIASLRNLAIGILHVHGHCNIAAALRRNAATPPDWCPPCSTGL